MPASRLERWRSDGELARELAPVIAAARESARGAALASARDAALRGGAGALGVQDTLQALAEGRVRLLLLPATAPITGQCGSDGAVYPPSVSPPGIDPAELTDDTQLADLLLRNAVAQGADVVVLSGADETELGRDEVAALLRW